MLNVSGIFPLPVEDHRLKYNERMVSNLKAAPQTTPQCILNPPCPHMLFARAMKIEDVRLVKQKRQ